MKYLQKGLNIHMLDTYTKSKTWNKPFTHKRLTKTILLETLCIEDKDTQQLDFHLLLQNQDLCERELSPYINYKFISEFRTTQIFTIIGTKTKSARSPIPPFIRYSFPFLIFSQQPNRHNTKQSKFIYISSMLKTSLAV